MNSNNPAIENNITALPSTPKPQTSKEVIAANVQLLIEQLEAGHSEGLPQQCGRTLRNVLQDAATSASGSSCTTQLACFACLEGCVSHGRELCTSEARKMRVPLACDRSGAP